MMQNQLGDENVVTWMNVFLGILEIDLVQVNLLSILGINYYN